MFKENIVICPVYDEEDTIRQFYQDLRRYYDQDVLFVDDGSRDKSRDFLLRIKGENTLVIRHPQRYGYGAALLSGFKFAHDKGYKRIVTIDTDLQHNPERIPIFLRELFEFEVVLGSRYIRIDKYFEVPCKRLIINCYISQLIKTIFSTRFSDPFCGFRGYRDSFLRKAQLKEKSYGLSLEILLEIIRTETSFKELFVEAIYFKDVGKFLDGLDDPRRRLLYYLEVISRKKKQIINEKEIFSGKPSS